MNAGGVGLAVVVILAASSDCGRTPKPIEPERRRLVREARALWVRSGPPCYEITEELGNFWRHNGAWTLTVCHGRLVSVRDDRGAPPLPSLLTTGFSNDDTVEGLFAEAERYANRDPLEFYYSVEFDPEMGFPREINCGLRNAYDAEWIVHVVNLVPFDCARCGDADRAGRRPSTAR